MIFTDCAILVRDSVDPSSISGNTPYIGLEHIEQSTLKYAKTGVASEVFSIKNKYLSGDILFGKLRPYFRKVIRVDINGICSTDIWVIRPKEGIDSRFLFYWCASDQFVRSLTKASVGTKMPRAKWEVAERLEVPNHSFKEQQAIGQVLGALDCKIDKNREMVSMLVEIANSLFNSWFVKFEPVRLNNTPPPLEKNKQLQIYKNLFPSELVDSEIGLIPKGWRVSSLEKFGEIVSGRTPPTKKQNYFGGDYPFITIPDMHNRLINITSKRSISEIGATLLSKKLLPRGAICVSCIATPGLVTLTTKPSFTNEQVNTIIPKESMFKSYLLFMANNLKSKILEVGGGSNIFTYLRLSEFRKLPVLRPPDYVVKKFSDFVDPMLERIELCLHEIEILAQLRDTLLPKLILGELRIPDAERLLEEVEI